MSAAEAAPVKDPQRPPAFDALCGIAVVGVVCSMVYNFGLPSQAVYNPSVLSRVDELNRLIWAANFVFGEGTFQLLAAMLFGAFCLMVCDGQSARSPIRYQFGVAILFLCGLVHWIVFAVPNLLGGLALAGAILPFVMPLAARALYALAIGFVALHVGGGFVVFGGSVIDFYMSRAGTDAALFADRNYGTDPPALNYGIELGREALGDRFGRKIADLPAALYSAAKMLPLNLAAMALGMAFWKDGLFARRWRIFRMQRLAAICSIVAVPALFALAWWIAAASFPGALVGVGTVVLSAPFNLLLAVTYAALGMAFFHQANAATAILAITGKLGFSNYLIVSAVFSAVFASWGLGNFAELTRAEIAGIGILAAGAAILWSPAFLKLFGSGPAERVWNGVLGQTR